MSNSTQSSTRPSKKWIRGTIAALAVCLVGFGGLHLRAQEDAVTETPPEGGEWSYGANGGRVWSSFLHSGPHGTTVRGHEFVDSGCVDGKVWARAHAPTKWVPVTKNEHDKRLC